MKSTLKKLLKQLGLYERVAALRLWILPKITRLARLCSFKNQRITTSYLSGPGLKKLHIGCSGNHLPGWLNTDLWPQRDQIYLDATRHFPLPTESFDYVYSEHMIEHIPWQSALFMLRECCRILKPGGVIRIATPNIHFLARLLRDDHTELDKKYLEHNSRALVPWAPYPGGVFVVNHYMRAWGHQFIFDVHSLTHTLELAGFKEATECQLNESSNKELSGLAAVSRMPDGFLALETIIVEGRKPQ